MAQLSSRRGLTELEQIQVCNEILGDNVVGECSSDEENSDEEDYTQLLHQTTHEISESEHESDGDCHIEGQQGGVSTTFLWRDIATFANSRKKFCDVCGPQLDISSDVGIVDVFEKLFDLSLVQDIVEETNKCAQQQIDKCAAPFTFCSRIRKGKDVTVDEMYFVLALFMLMEIVEKPTQRSYYSKNCLLFTSFLPETLSLERLELIIRFLHFNENSVLNEYIGPAKLFKIYPVIEQRNHKFRQLYLPKQNIVIDESLEKGKTLKMVCGVF
jgi:hypothetical protein